MRAVPYFEMKPGERLVSLRDSNSEKPSTPTRDGRRAGAGAGDRPLLSVRAVRKTFVPQKGSWLGTCEAQRVPAVDNVSFDIERGECLGLVGESGCGKTTLSKIIMRAVTPDSGAIVFSDGALETDLLKLAGGPLKTFRPRIQMVFQDPVSSLSPRMTVLNILREPLQIHGRGDRKAQVDRAVELMQAVGLDPRFLNRYPHSFSGGQRQRIGIARALALNPEMVICDEPVSALDVSVQAQILNLLKDLKSELGLTYLFISHNLAVVDYMADRIAVMARGRLVEIAPRHLLFRTPVHPYTRALLKAVPYPDLDRPLDFKLLNLGGACDEAAWAPPFRPNGGATSLRHIELGEGHIVLANPNADVRELSA
jgi:peptide/nickel transport system ATP-binding protein